MMRWIPVCAALAGGPLAAPAAPGASGATVDFNRDIRPILSNNCFLCHGPDAGERKADLRLDIREVATAVREGVTAIVPGSPGASELIHRVQAADEGDRMPPPESGKSLSTAEIALLERWISEGAPYAQHWSYVKPERLALPAVGRDDWPKNPVDYFILARLEAEGLAPSLEASRAVLARRAALDLTGLPPSPEETAAFVADPDPLAFERYVDGLLKRPSYGEHWARMWLDLARYADSSGYADDPPRTIWAYRDYVIRAFNNNTPFDSFTVEQLAGDLLPDATEEQLIATAFHRNTQTNNEGGTNDEEFRNVAVVDRVNTTMSVWMGTTMACAQCHSHKYDPISQADYFRMFAILNNTEDADRTDESPTIGLFSNTQRREQEVLREEIAGLESELGKSTSELTVGQAAWETALREPADWRPMLPGAAVSEDGASLQISEDGFVRVDGLDADGDVYRLSFAVPEGPVAALRLEVAGDAQPSEGKSGVVLTNVQAAHDVSEDERLMGRYVRIDLTGPRRILSLAEVQVFEGEKNAAPEGTASQSSTAFNGPARLAVDGNTNGDYNAGTTTHTRIEDDPWWELDLKENRPIDRLVVWNRSDGGGGIAERLSGFRLSVLDASRRPVFFVKPDAIPAPSGDYRVEPRVALEFAGAYAPSSREGFEAEYALQNPDPAQKGWAPDLSMGALAELILPLSEPWSAEEGTLSLRLAVRLPKGETDPARLRVSWTGAAVSAAVSRTPGAIRRIALLAPEERSTEQRAELEKFYRAIAPELEPLRQRLAGLRLRLKEMKPETTLPVLRELVEGNRRVTRLQYRGNFLDLGEELSEALPEAFPGIDSGGRQRTDRLVLARWLVSKENPLTARVTVNRYWEKLFGSGLVLTSEEFGSQGELPSHPELLDWLAVEFMESGWDLKGLLRLLVTSATYRQSSRVDPGLLERDPANRLLARGPRYRLPAETIRDQALAVSGLLSEKMFGPPVRPPQPSLGLSAAFGGGIDWETSAGEDRYRRGLYTTWRRSNPYPSMATFDAPNREVCTVRRERTNTPLQALVTLNDPVFVEAAQALGRRIASVEGDAAARAQAGFRLCMVREPSGGELESLVRLYQDSLTAFQGEPEAAVALATEPLGPLPEGADATEFAAWTVVSNVLLNLDEFLMRP